ncbi:TonB-dependent siderophore receptor [Shewanella sp. WXL01]|uniref:TonB-dependent siderophore receptor n=1 Tax=Shewanella sp. WXL01 TaxID=2709721 RepID=UPI001FD9EFB8|nr:TonB-dependent siderophore receptor [Shewanella sp. WXL01]
MYKLSALAVTISLTMAASNGAAHEGMHEHHKHHDHHQAFVETINVHGVRHVKPSNSSAMKLDMSQLDTPGSVSVYGADLIEAQGAVTLGQVLHNDASVSTGNVRRGRERFYMRGFVLEPDQSYMRDGQFHLSRYAQPIELYERIEVLKGPSALLYGKSTPAGMINLVTKSAKAERHFSLEQEFGSFGYHRSMADFGGALNAAETVRGRAIISKAGQTGWRKYKDGSYAEQDRLVGALMLEADLSDDTIVSFNFDSTNDDAGIDMGAQHEQNPETGKWERVGKRDFIWDMPWSKRESSVENMGVTLNSNLSDYWTLTAGANYQVHERQTTESMYGKIGKVGGSLTTGKYKLRGRDTFEKFDVSTVFLDFKGEFHTGNLFHNVLLGSSVVDYRKTGMQKKVAIAGEYDINDAIIIDKPADLDYRKGEAISEVSRVTNALYIQDLIEFNEQWHLLAGLRFDRERNNKATHFNVLPKLAVMYHPTPETTVYGTYSESFEPTDPISNSADINDKKQFDAMRGKSLEIGVKREFFDGGLLVSTAAFDIEQTNKLVTEKFDADENGKTQITTAAGRVRHQGLELAMEGYLSDSLLINASMMYLDGKIISDPKYAGKRSKDTARFSASSWLSYQLNDDTNLHLKATYEGDRFGDTPNKFKKDGYVKVDVGMSYQLKFANDQQAIIRVNVDNLFGTDYLTGGCMNSATNSAGRSIKASLQYQF